MVEGVILTEGTAPEIAADERVRAVYLGCEVRGTVPMSDRSEAAP
jgi:ABC-type lipopolysaccharide export system ATPase subunit